MKQPVLETDFEKLNLIKRGKVRDIYDLGDKLLMVATDRISAFDVVMPDSIPEKGIILTQISLFWFEIMESILPHHVISSNVDDFPASCKPYAEILQGRSMLVKKAEPLPIECVVRGYISGSGWKDYQADGSLCGLKLPEGLKESDKLPEPVFTPSTKAEIGLHDVNIDFEEVVKIENNLILIDELLTPDSSRFWPKASYRPGGPQMSFDKQYVRDYLISINWDKKPPGPPLPKDVITSTRNKYLEAFKILTHASHAP
jgi:phosphoribosylaminoimidazole-succinocarboxamide synthase